MKKIFLIAIATVLISACATKDKRPLAQAISQNIVLEMNNKMPQELENKRLAIRREVTVYQELGCLSQDSAQALGAMMEMGITMADKHSSDPALINNLTTALEDRLSYKELERAHAMNNKNTQPDLNNVDSNVKLMSKVMGIFMEVYMGNIMTGFMDQKNLESLMKEIDNNPNFKNMDKIMKSDEWSNLENCVQKALINNQPIQQRKPNKSKFQEGLY